MFDEIKKKWKIIHFHKLICTTWQSLNLSHVDLSRYDEKFWHDVILKDVDLSYCKIKILSQHLKEKNITNVNFEGVDFSNFSIEELSGFVFHDCNLKKTNLHLNHPNKSKEVKVAFYNCQIDSSVTFDWAVQVDLATLMINPNYSFSPYHKLNAINAELAKKRYLILPLKDEFDTEYNIKKIYNLTKAEYLSQIRQTVVNYSQLLKQYFPKAYETIKKLKSAIPEKKLYMFIKENKFFEVTFKNIHFTEKDLEILEDLNFEKCTFLNCCFDLTYDEFDRKMNYENRKLRGLFDITNSFDECYLSSLDYRNSTQKIHNTSLSCQTSIYLKLSAECNGKCSFCKNNTEVKKTFSMSAILASLNDPFIYSYLNQVYFGGGEPTLKLKEIESILKLLQTLNTKPISWNIFTNGSGDYEYLAYLVNTYPLGRIILSRQAIEDKKNKEIMGVEYNLEDKNLKLLLQWGLVTLAMTCCKENWENNLLQNYLYFGHFIGCKDFIFQNLEKKSDQTSFDVSSKFKEFGGILEAHDFIKKRIISTSYFEMLLYKNHKDKIALKEYFGIENFNNKWNYSPKHSYDLGMDEAGVIFNDFQMMRKLTKNNRQEKNI